MIALFILKSELCEPQHDKPSKIKCAASEDSDQTAPSSLSAWRSLGSLAHIAKIRLI